MAGNYAVSGVKWRLAESPSHDIREFEARWRRRLPQEIDGLHTKVAGDLTKAAIRIVGEKTLRPWEQDVRPGRRRRQTGKLTGRRGQAAIRAHSINRGLTPSGRWRQGKGVSFPDVPRLDRMALHWRAQEFGVESVTMPVGLFIDGAGNPAGVSKRTFGHTFIPLGEFYESKGLTKKNLRTIRGSSRARTAKARRAKASTRTREGERSILVKRQGEGYEGKFYIQGAWQEVVGQNGQHIEAVYVKRIDDLFSQFRLR